MATYWDYSDYFTNITSSYYNSPTLAAHGFSAELGLVHRDEWVDENVLGSDFQSNQAERPASLAGLGIQNLRTPDVYNQMADLESNSSNPPKTSLGDFDGLPLFDPSGVLSAYDYYSCNENGDLSEIKPGRQLSLDSEISEPLKSEDSLSSDSSTDFALMFEQLSASTGLSIADFAEQLSASAEVTLKRMAEEGLGSEMVTSVKDQIPSSSEETQKWSTPQLFLPRSTSWENDGIGVNPADILPPDSPGPMYIEESQYLPPSAFSYEAELSGHVSAPDNDLNTPRTANTPFVKQEELLYLPQPSPVSSSLPEAHPSRSLSDDERSVFQSPSSSDFSPDASVGQKRPAGSRRIDRRIPIATGDSIPNTPGSQSPDLPLNIDETNLPPINLGTPVLEAHRGVELEILKAKAERYRLRNQGRDYDKRWLISFAGKLSARGELVDEFHCYVVGCNQKNKRRDHILIHVGAHLDQRPFKCMYCPSRFLRKNECKRHELSHTGLRPFSCHICPYPSTTFVRQDLLKRHMKRTHRVDLRANKENLEEAYHPRKRSKY